MTIHGYTVRRRGAATIVNAIQPVPGLYIYCGMPHRRCGEDFHWHIGHHSGFLIASAQSALEARQVINEIADFTDWTRTAEDLQADADLDVAYLRERILYFTDGIFHLRSRPIAA